MPELPVSIFLSSNPPHCAGPPQQNLGGAYRKTVLGVVHLVELEKALVDSALDEHAPEH